jgi:hypothetical protein
VKHYYLQRLTDIGFWRKVGTGYVGLSAMRRLLRNVATALGTSRHTAPREDFRLSMAHAWRAFDGSILLVLSGRDLTAKEFLEALPLEPAWHGALDKAGLTRLDIAQADHTFSVRVEREKFEAALADWLDARFPLEAAYRKREPSQ